MNRKTGKRSIYDVNTETSNDLVAHLVWTLMNAKDSPSISHLRKEMFSKYVDPVYSVSAETRKTAAIEKWLAAERRNEETELRLQHTPWQYQILPGVAFERWLSWIRSFICRMIGEIPPNIDTLQCRFSGGASTSRSRKCSHPANKYVGRADITPMALPWLESFEENDDGLGRALVPTDLRMVEGNVMFTVPKTNIIDRVSCKEPDMNMFLQRGIGAYFDRCLQRHGINIHDQTKNRDLAKLGSLCGDLATLDLSSASDSVTCALVELLLPEYWYYCLRDLRSPRTKLTDGTWHDNIMISSMGNGFTFELETLVFFAIAKSVAYFRGIKGYVSVYGDDIIFPSSGYDDLVFVLAHCGFTVNSKKSFATGPFRESCGGHYYDGTDITPVYIKEPAVRLTDIIRLGNRLRKWSGNDGLGCLDSTFEPLWLEIRDLVPKCFWGGRDLGSITSLVTPDHPRKQMIGINKRRAKPHVGDVIHVLHCGGISDSGIAATTRYRSGKNNSEPCFRLGMFLSEINVMP